MCSVMLTELEVHPEVSAVRPIASRLCECDCADADVDADAKSADVVGRKNVHVRRCLQTVIKYAPQPLPQSNKKLIRR